MNALQSYSSDEESENEIQIKTINKMGDPGTNYDDVGMDISEDSGEESASRSISKSNISKKTNDGDKQQNKELRDGSLEVTKYSDRKDSNYRRKDRSRDHDRSSSSKESDNKHDSKRRGGDRNNKEQVSSSHRDRNRKDNRSHHRSSRNDRYSRKTKSPSRDRRRSKSRSRSRETRRRSRSSEKERRKPHEIRREAQHKLATFKALNPDYDHNELLRRGLEAQFAEVQKTTGLTLPAYYNPAVMNPVKIAEQERKKKLLWGNKSKPVEPVVAAPVIEPIQQCSVGDPKQAGIWANTKFSNDSDGKMAEKFKRLMGVKAPTPPGAPSNQFRGVPIVKPEQDVLQKQETMFTSMEKQYEVARLATHTYKGFGLGFSSQPYVPKQ